MTKDSNDPYVAAETLAVLAAKDPTPENLQAYEEAMQTINRLETPGYRKSSGKTQLELIVNHLKANGSITQREAFLDYGVQSLTRRITDLRSKGHNIVSEWREHPTTGQRYTRYYMVNR